MSSSKADLLLKKASSFEKLALYSDRKAFLQAVAQQEPPTDKFTDFERKEWYNDGGSTPVKYNVPEQEPNMGSPATPPPAMNAPAVREQNKPVAPALTRKNIDPQYQRLLGVKADGVWGKDTQVALDAYKAKIGQPNIADGTALGLLLSNSNA